MSRVWLVIAYVLMLLVGFGVACTIIKIVFTASFYGFNGAKCVRRKRQAGNTVLLFCIVFLGAFGSIIESLQSLIRCGAH